MKYIVDTGLPFKGALAYKPPTVIGNVQRLNHMSQVYPLAPTKFSCGSKGVFHLLTEKLDSFTPTSEAQAS